MVTSSGSSCRLFIAALLLTFLQQCIGKAAEKELRKIPDFLHVCSQNDPKINECVTETILNLRPHLAKGVPELNLPPIEPLLLGEILALQGGAGIRIKARDLKAYGCSNFTLNKMVVNVSERLMDLGLDFPQLTIDAMYRVDGRILLLPIFGDGPLKAKFNNPKANVTIRGEIVTRDGREYYHITDLQVKAKVITGTFYLENLFGGDKVLGNVVNSAINNNFKVFIDEITPSIERALSSSIMVIANNVVKAFTFDQLFPVDPTIA